MSAAKQAHLLPRDGTSGLIATAMEVFARGFAFTRSFTHPYFAERLGTLWMLRDGPRKNEDYRTEEYVAYGLAAEAVDRVARERTRGRFAVCAIHAIHESDVPLRTGYKRLGYRLMTTEPLMVQSLERIPTYAAPEGIVIHRVMDVALAERLNKATRSRLDLSRFFCADAQLRQYVALAGDKLVGWVRSISVAPKGGAGDGESRQATWCSNMGVLPPFRRRGIARALLSRMLTDDQAAGSGLAVLLASHTGALVYPLLGYEQIGTLMIFTPKKKKATS